MLKLKNSRGFTLIELLIVIAIIGILAAIVLVSLNDARISARDTQRIGNIRNATLALELFFDAEGGYPASSASCDDPLGAGNVFDKIGVAGVDDPLSQTWMYGSDSTDGTTDDAANYILGVILERDAIPPNHANVDVFGCDCTVANAYCVQP